MLLVCVACWFLVKKEIELGAIVLWKTVLGFKSLFKRQKKACRDCAYLSFFGAMDLDGPSSVESFSCKCDHSHIEKNELDSKSCRKFIRKKEGLTLEQQIHGLWINRLKRNWYYISALAISFIVLIITVWKLLNP